MGEEIHSFEVGLRASLTQSPGGEGDSQVNSQVKPLMKSPLKSTPHSVWHYLISAPPEVMLTGPVAFNNFTRSELARSLAVRADFDIDLELPWRQGPGPVHWGVEGESTLKTPVALRGVDVLARFEELADILERVAARKIPFAETKRLLDSLQLPGAYRNRVLESVFRPADAASPLPTQPSSSPKSTVSPADDLDRLLSHVGSEPGIPLESTVAPTGVQGLIAAVGGQATGFELNEAGAQSLLAEVRRSAGKAMDALLGHSGIQRPLAFLTGLNRIAKKADARKKQIVHLVPNSWGAEELQIYLQPYLRGEAEPARLAALCFPYGNANHAGLARLADTLDAVLCLQLNADESASTLGDALSGNPMAARVFLFDGQVARRVEGPTTERCLFQPALLTFIEGLLSENAAPGDYLEHSLTVADQDVHDGPGRVSSTRELLTDTEWIAASDSGVNLANGTAGADTVRFRPLHPLRSVSSVRPLNSLGGG